LSSPVAAEVEVAKLTTTLLVVVAVVESFTVHRKHSIPAFSIP
jgi:hypothetical protein